MDEHGEATGTVTMIYRGAPALNWRQRFLRGDATSLNHNLQAAMERLMPGGMDVKVKSIEKLEEYEEPLVVKFDVKGQIASSTGKRLLVPGDIFEVNAKPAFPHEKRDAACLFRLRQFDAGCGARHVPGQPRHGVASCFRPGAVPEDCCLCAQDGVDAHQCHGASQSSVGDIIFDLNQFPDLRAFYSKFETKDQEPVVLKVATPAAGGN